MPRDGDHPSPSSTTKEAGPRRARAALIGLGAVAILTAAYLVDRTVSIRPGAAQVILISRGGEVSGVYGPGQSGYLNPWSQGRAIYSTALVNTDRSTPDRGMPAVSAEGHPLIVFGTALWHEGTEEDLRWRFAHVRGETDLLPPLMAASVQAVMGRHTMDEIIRAAPAIGSELTEDLRARARALLRVEVAAFTLTRIDPGESYRQVVAERELGRARAVSVAASPAMAGNNPNAMELERIRRWDGRGIIPERPGRPE